MIERPIIFSGPMVRAILEGRKTMTRRVVKPQPCGLVRWNADGDPYDEASGNWPRCPYGQPCDRLWVREVFCPVDDRELGGDKWIDYRATPKYGEDEPGGWGPDTKGDPDRLTWRSPLFMPRSAARLTLVVEDVRVERLQEITEEDARAEGVGAWFAFEASRCKSAREAFAVGWDSINGKRPGAAWADNPWVWAITFKRLETPDAE